MRLSEESQRRIGESVIWWLTIWTWVAVERLLHQWADLWVVLSAWAIQTASTFFMALGSISFYDWMVDRFPWELHDSMKKIAVGWSLATLSWIVNYVWQLKTQWSFQESMVMFSLAAGGLMVYEYEVIPKIKNQIEKNKYITTQIILDIGNTLWLK